MKPTTATWQDFDREAPEFAAFVRSRIEEHGLALLATLRADGSPRISGLEPLFSGDQLWFGMMLDSVKGADLRRDGRFALHNATIDKDVAKGDVKVNGIAVLVEDRSEAGVPDLGQDADLFAAQLTSVSSVRVGGDHLVLESWRPGQGVTSRKRY